MPPHPLLLLPPSAGKASDGTGPPWHLHEQRFVDLADARTRVRAAVERELRVAARRAKVFGVGERSVADALHQWRMMDDAPTLPAFARYTGVVWTALDPATLGSVAHRRLREWVLVVSGLWGLVGADEPLPAYRLPVGARVPALGGSLAAFWRPALTEALARYAGNRWIFDLLPDDHAAALADQGLRRCRIQILAQTADGRRAIGHAGKAAKGRLARAILQAAPTTPMALSKLEVDGLTLLDVGPDRAVFLATPD